MSIRFTNVSSGIVPKGFKLSKKSGDFIHRQNSTIVGKFDKGGQFGVFSGGLSVQNRENKHERLIVDLKNVGKILCVWADNDRVNEAVLEENYEIHGITFPSLTRLSFDMRGNLENAILSPVDSLTINGKEYKPGTRLWFDRKGNVKSTDASDLVEKEMEEEMSALKEMYED